jgi:hypothetical protein
MTTEISGKVEDASGNAIQGATVYIVRQSDDSIVATETTDSAGEYQVVGLSDTDTYHVTAQYDDGSTKYAGTSYPEVTPFTSTGPIDDFEDADITEYTGDKNSYTTQTSRVFEKTTALKMGNDDGAGHQIFSTSGLPRYPSAGDTFAFRTYIENSISEMAMLFGVQDSSNYYRARVIKSANEIAIGKVVGGSSTNLDFAAASIPTGEWIRGIVEWTNSNELRLTLNDESGTKIAETALVTDSEFGSGGIGWDGFVDGFSGDSVYYDIAELTSIGGAPSVTTLSPTNVSVTDATLEGNLDSIGNDTEADVYFSYKEVGGSFTDTIRQTKSATGAFDEQISVDPSTDYEYKAVAENDIGSSEGSLIAFSTPATSVIDDFEDADVAEYNQFSGDPAQVGFTTSDVQNGTYALSIEGDDSDDSLAAPGIYSTSGLDNYPESGKQWKYYVKTNIFAGFLFGAGSGNDAYNLTIVTDNNKMNLRKLNNGDPTVIRSLNANIQPDTWYQSVVNLQNDGKISWRLEQLDGTEVGTLKGDISPTGTGVGFRSDNETGDVSRYDYVRLTGSSDSVTLDTLIVDNFEDNNLNEYTETVNSGVFQTQSGVVDNGEYALEKSSTSSGSNPEIISTSGLDNYPEQGDTIRYSVRFESSSVAFPGFLFGVQDGSNYYYVDTDSDSDIRIRKSTSSGGSILASSTGSFGAGTWHDVVIDWQTDGTITATINGNTSVTATDTTFTTGGIGFRGDDENVEYFDHVRIDN